VTVLELIALLGYPVVIVTRAGLGTLNHTAMTVRLLREAGVAIAGLVVNGYVADPGSATAPASSSVSSEQGKPSAEDVSMAGNRRWLERMNRTSILATLPWCDPKTVRPEEGQLPAELLEAGMMVRWEEYVRPPTQR
jgi:dethiobiotin synthetase